MLIVHVFVHVKPDCVADFKSASLENARHSVQEPGIARFDVIQQADDPTLSLIHIYRSRSSAAASIATSNRDRWIKLRGRG